MNIVYKLEDEKNRKMNRSINFVVVLFTLLYVSCNNEKDEWIRINQLGYRNNDIKVAVFISKQPVILEKYQVMDAESGWYLQE